jgi:hypothetical protein
MHEIRFILFDIGEYFVEYDRIYAAVSALYTLSCSAPPAFINHPQDNQQTTRIIPSIPEDCARGSKNPCLVDGLLQRSDRIGQKAVLQYEENAIHVNEITRELARMFVVPLFIDFLVNHE